MKTVGIALVLCVGLVAGCGGDGATTPAVEDAPEAGGAMGILGQKGAAESSLNLTKIQNAVTHYQTGKGSYPASLNDLVPDYLPMLPRKPDGSMYAYDPSTGKVGP